MSTDPYGDRVRELFAVPVHAGELEGGRSVYLDDQGVRIRLAARAEAGRISTMRFEAWGCPHVIAAAEAICARLEGASAADLLDFSANDLMENLPVPVEKTGRILVLEDAVRSLGRTIGDGS
jgi:NifU-like protein involved in Fe-S cluster formation